jgi:hypothetical protein
MYTNQVHLANSVEHRDNEPDFEDMLSRQLAGALAGKRKWSVFYVQTQLENNTGRERERESCATRYSRWSQQQIEQRHRSFDHHPELLAGQYGLQ